MTEETLSEKLKYLDEEEDEEEVELNPEQKETVEAMKKVIKDFENLEGN